MNVHGVSHRSCVSWYMKYDMIPPTTALASSWPNRMPWNTTRGYVDGAVFARVKSFMVGARAAKAQVCTQGMQRDVTCR